MKVRCMSAQLLALGALVALAVLSVVQGIQPARAFEDPDERFFPMVGVARGQTARLNVVGDDGPGSRSCDVTMLFCNSRGVVLARDVKKLAPGTATFLDLRYAAIGDPTIRAEIRAKVIGDPHICAASLEVFDDETGRSTLITKPWVAR